MFGDAVNKQNKHKWPNFGILRYTGLHRSRSFAFDDHELYFIDKVRPATNLCIAWNSHMM